MARLIRHDEIFLTNYGQRLILCQLSARSLVSSLDRHESTAASTQPLTVVQCQNLQSRNVTRM